MTAPPAISFGGAIMLQASFEPCASASLLMLRVLMPTWSMVGLVWGLGMTRGGVLVATGMRRK